MKSRYFGFTIKGVKKLAYYFDEETGIPYLFNKTKKEAGWD